MVHFFEKLKEKLFKKKHIPSSIEKELEEVPLGVYPKDVHVRALPERRYLWTTRFISLFTTVSMCVNIILGGLILLNFSAVSTAPRLFLWSEANQEFIRPELFLKGQIASEDSLEALRVEMVNQYVIDRYTITSDLAENELRWGKPRMDGAGGNIYKASSEDVYAIFKERQANRWFMLAGNGLTRQVMILRTVPVDTQTQGTLYQTDFQMIEKTSKGKEVSYWSAFNRVGFRKEMKDENDPVGGFLVVSHGLSANLQEDLFKEMLLTERQQLFSGGGL